MLIADLIERLIVSEGIRLKPYRDTVGKLTIGIGRNLDDNGISTAEARQLCVNDISDVMDDLDRSLPWWSSMNEVRQLVIAEMCFNLGLTRLKTFELALGAMRIRKYNTAAEEMLDSKWARQVGKRAEKLSKMMRTGTTD